MTQGIWPYAALAISTALAIFSFWALRDATRMLEDANKVLDAAQSLMDDHEKHWADRT